MDGAAHELAAAGRAIEALLHDLLRDAESSRDVALREALEEISLDDLALLCGERAGDGAADGVLELGAGRVVTAVNVVVAVIAVIPGRAGAGEAHARSHDFR